MLHDMQDAERREMAYRGWDAIEPPEADREAYDAELLRELARRVRMDWPDADVLLESATESDEQRDDVDGCYRTLTDAVLLQMLLPVLERHRRDLERIDLQHRAGKAVLCFIAQLGMGGGA
jgi:hypothetical protein